MKTIFKFPDVYGSFGYPRAVVYVGCNVCFEAAIMLLVYLMDHVNTSSRGREAVERLSMPQL